MVVVNSAHGTWLSRADRHMMPGFPLGQPTFIKNRDASVSARIPPSLPRYPEREAHEFARPIKDVAKEGV